MGYQYAQILIQTDQWLELNPEVSQTEESTVVQHLDQRLPVKDVDIEEHETIGLTPGR